MPAWASSHSASVVKPTMIASIQYCERTASLRVVVEHERAVVGEHERGDVAERRRSATWAYQAPFWLSSE